MSNETMAVIAQARRDWKTDHLAMYLGSGGAAGHVMDVTAVGGHAFTTHCLIRYRGRKSGNIYVTPLIYGDLGGAVVVCASKGGADHNPAWYLNLIDKPEIEFQIATQAFRATWREPNGEERAKVWAFMVDSFPPYAAYQESTARQIPLIMMKAVDVIGVLRA